MINLNHQVKKESSPDMSTSPAPSNDKTWTGQLEKLKKKDLEEIADAMGIPHVPKVWTKYDLVDHVRDVLYNKLDVREDPRFVGLWEQTLEGKRWVSSHDLAGMAKSVASSPARSVRDAASHLPSPPSASQLANGLDSITHSLADAADSTAQTLKPAARATLSASRQAASATASAVQPVATQAADAFSTAAMAAASTAVQSLNDVNNQITPRNLRHLRRSASKRTLAAAKLAKEETIEVVGTAQAKLSEGWVIVAALVGLEAAWLVWEALTWDLHSIGPFKWFLFNHTTPAKFYRLPNLGQLFVPPFTSSILPYTIITILFPLIASLFFALPKEAPEKRTLAPPNPVTFSIARLGLVILSGYVFAGLSDRHDAFEHVVGYPEVAVLGSAASVLLTALAQFQRA